MNWGPWRSKPTRATFEPDYGRRGKLWVHGAFEPATGQGSFEPATGQGSLVYTGARDSVSHIQLLEQILREFPADRWLIIEDNLSAHTSRETQLALLAHPEMQVQFIPKYACWLNLIEPWWKQIHSLALKGRRFETREELIAALEAALTYWNDHRHPYHWKKQPQEQPRIFLGGLRPELTRIANAT